MIILEPINLTWIGGEIDNPTDLCAHGRVWLKINDASIVTPDDGEWTVSAAALYLLRTLTGDHTKKAPLFEHVFPCCGFSMFDIEGEDNVVIAGCPNGINFEIVHKGETMVLRSFEPGAQNSSCKKNEWKKAVIDFSTKVRDFYDSSSPKILADPEGKKGFEKFMQEWTQRHESTVYT